MTTAIGIPVVPLPIIINYDGSRWELIEHDALSVPDYIEGNARGTIKRMYGHYYRKQEPDDRFHRPEQ